MVKKILFWLIFLGALIGLVLILSKNTTNLPEKVLDPEDATYLIDETPITLTDGLFEGLVAVDSAAVERWQISKKIEGDLNGDTKSDWAVVLYGNTGGTGTFYYLAAVVGSGESIPAVFVGDRISISSLMIEDGIVKLVYEDRNEGEPLATEPTVEKKLLYRLENGELVLEG
ncbi:MAG: Uncharacterized protein G01um101420_437 [Parcubacteria group bacterium Gr01-1014_20]|nr:MAG: Uncharacterized protein G01um101420_437 [Parcubacteria group bacterium Gr01-1014_20]